MACLADPPAPPPLYRSEAFAEDLPGWAEAAAAEAPPLRRRLQALLPGRLAGIGQPVDEVVQELRLV